MNASYAFLGLVSISFGGFLLAVIATAARLSVERTHALRALKERDEIITTQKIICNRRYIEMYGLDPDRVRPRMLFSDIVTMRYEAGACPEISQQEYLAWRSRAGNADRPSDTVYRLKNGHVFAIHYRPMADGAWVATTDDITERQRLAEKVAEQHKLRLRGLIH
jgi:PAS domain-containing protein